MTNSIKDIKPHPAQGRAKPQQITLRKGSYLFHLNRTDRRGSEFPEACFDGNKGYGLRRVTRQVINDI